MFIGHYSIAFAAAAHQDAPKLGTLFVAAQLVDIGFFVLVLTGGEAMRVTPGITVMNPLDLYHMPYTHSLIGTLLWATAFLALLRLLGASWRAGLIGALVVLSHWGLDLLVHGPDLTIFGAPPKFGLGLWNYPLIEMPLELGLTGGAYWLYLRATTSQDRSPAVPLLALFLLGVQLFNWFAPQPAAFDNSIPLSALIAYGMAIWLASRVARGRIHKGGVMNELIRRAPSRSAKTSLWLGILAVVLAVAGAYGAGQGLWPFGPGLLMVAASFVLAIIGGLTGLFASFRNVRGSGLGRTIMIGLLLAVAVFSGVGPWIYRGVTFPPIHDVTTDLASPPAFSVIPSRQDNLAGVGTIDAWRTLHQKAYADVKPITLAMTPAAAIARAKQLVTARGWVITPTAADRIEATATESPFKFKDDVVIVATPAPDGASTIINMRSVSRVGVSDFGLNAKRIRAFLADLPQ